MCAYPRTRGEIAAHVLECERGVLFERRPSNPIVRIAREGGGDVNVWLGPRDMFKASLLEASLLEASFFFRGFVGGGLFEADLLWSNQKHTAVCASPAHTLCIPCAYPAHTLRIPPVLTGASIVTVM